MIWPPWKKHHAHPTDELAEARRSFARKRAQLEEQKARAHGATWRLAVAVGEEQAEIRRNHLGELMHAALTAPGRHDR